MAANFDTGMFVRQPAWHGQGHVADRHPADWSEARQWAGLDWEPVEAPNFGYHGLRADGTVTHRPDEAVSGDYFADEGHKRIVRDDTGALLAAVHSQYTLITHAEMGSVVDAILDQPSVRYDTAGSLAGGRSVWALVLLDEPVVLPGDISQTFPYLALLNRHDGTGAFRALSTSVRVVCANTFSAAEAQGEGSGTVFTFRHSASWRSHVEEARETIRGLRADFGRYVELASDLARTPVTEAQRAAFISEFIPMPPETMISDRVVANVDLARTQIREILASPTTEAIAGTALGLVQAAGEWADHYRATRSLDGRYPRQLLRPEKLKTSAVRIVREVTGSAV